MSHPQPPKQRWTIGTLILAAAVLVLAVGGFVFFAQTPTPVPALILPPAPAGPLQSRYTNSVERVTLIRRPTPFPASPGEEKSSRLTISLRHPLCSASIFHPWKASPCTTRNARRKGCLCSPGIGRRRRLPYGSSVTAFTCRTP